MGKGPTSHAKVLHFKSRTMTTNTHDIVLLVTVKLDNWHSTTDETQ